MTNRESKLREKRLNLERDARRLLKQLIHAALLDNYRRMPVKRARAVGTRGHMGQRS